MSCLKGPALGLSSQISVASASRTHGWLVMLHLGSRNSEVPKLECAKGVVNVDVFF